MFLETMGYPHHWQTWHPDWWQITIFFNFSPQFVILKVASPDGCPDVYVFPFKVPTEEEREEKASSWIGIESESKSVARGVGQFIRVHNIRSEAAGSRTSLLSEPLPHPTASNPCAASVCTTSRQCGTRKDWCGQPVKCDPGVGKSAKTSQLSLFQSLICFVS